MAAGTPTDDSPSAIGPATGAETQSPVSGSPVSPTSILSGLISPSAIAPNHVSLAFDDQQWRDANRVLDGRYLELGRAQIDEMCLDLKARLAARMSAGLQERLAAEGPTPDLASPDLASPEAGRQIEAAAAMAAKLLDDISWMLPWEQARSMVEPYAKGSWLLAQIQVIEEQRVVAIFAAELMAQATSYMRELIFRFYGADQAEPTQKPQDMPSPDAPVGDQGAS
jgi:hypothetical protein